MKKIFLTLIALLPGLIPAENLNAEKKTFLPILEIGKEWTYISNSVLGDEHLNEPAEPFGYKAVESIQEDGHEVFLLYLTGYDMDSIKPGEEDLYISKAYEEDGVLWYFSVDELEYLPMIDFNLEVGDKVYIREVIWKGTVNIEGIERCVMAIHSPGSDEKVFYWCEGIGAINDAFLSPMIMSMCGKGVYMTECWMGDKCLFDKSRFDVAVAEVNSLTVQNESKDIYDMMGRRISSPAPGQLYIRDGKKYIGK